MSKNFLNTIILSCDFEYFEFVFDRTKKFVFLFLLGFFQIFTSI